MCSTFILGIVKEILYFTFASDFFILCEEVANGRRANIFVITVRRSQLINYWV